jgi:hypothetical protein
VSGGVVNFAKKLITKTRKNENTKPEKTPVGDSSEISRLFPHFRDVFFVVSFFRVFVMGFSAKPGNPQTAAKCLMGWEFF